MRNQKAIKILALVFSIIGVAFLATGLILYMEKMSFERDAVAVDAVITDFPHSGSGPFIAYSYGGNDYTGRMNYDSSNMYIGQTVLIHVNPQNPQEFRDQTNNVVGLVFTIVGAAFLIPGVIMAVLALRNSRRAYWLRSNGTQVMADILDVVPATAGTNMRHRNMAIGPYTIRCTWTDPQSSTEYIFSSDPFRVDPSALIEKRGIKQLVVYVDPYDPKKYWIPADEVRENVVVA